MRAIYRNRRVDLPSRAALYLARDAADGVLYGALSRRIPPTLYRVH